jgi:hypothetical protein
VPGVPELADEEILSMADHDLSGVKVAILVTDGFE